tara:strand:+ start:389 stop:562 length:174 start_codon:yes stop_codon:yes gene_type:complete
MTAIKIHNLITGKITTVKSGDNEKWKKLNSVDQSMIIEVLRHGIVIRCGKTIYEPIK